jgi:HEPN domain-containing protein
MPDAREAVCDTRYFIPIFTAAMSSSYVNEQDKLDRYINAFATQSFRDQADRDYIAARLACRAELMPQFLWASQQAIEKYLKGILLYNRVKASKVKHDLLAALKLTEQLPRVPFSIDLSARSRKFINHLATYGQYRYVDVPYHVEGHVLVDLDLAVWELRRYCQVLNVFGKKLPPREVNLLDQALADLAQCSNQPRYKFRLHGGFLEQVLDKAKHPARAALLWQNAMYGVRKRSTVSVKSHFQGGNPILYLYPEMLDELLKFVFVTNVREYREHLTAIKADPSQRP